MKNEIDNKLISLYQSREENAISETKNLYGRLIYSVAFNLLRNAFDAEECESDTYVELWNAIPPAEPKNFKAFCLKITRNLAMKKLEYYRAEKRDCSKTVSYEAILQETGEIDLLVNDVKESEISQCIDDFLDGLDKKKRKVFVLRYWYLMSVKEIMAECRMSKSQVESILFRTRNQLRKKLVEGSFYDE